MIRVLNRFRDPIVNSTKRVIVWNQTEQSVVITVGESKQPCFIIITPETWHELVRDVNKIIRVNKIK